MEIFSACYNLDMVNKVLVVEDEAALREALAYNLTRQGYEVKTANDGRAALDSARKNHPDLIILDLMLPVLDGIEVCRILRQEMSVPILMLTARDDELDRVVGLEIGADDYITKPFGMRELMARVKAHLRRVRLDASGNKSPELSEHPVKIFGDLELDAARREVRRSGKPVALKPKEYDLLSFLALHQGQALSRETIMEQVWGWDFSGGSRTVDVHISWLRDKIEPDPSFPTRIITVRGAGYRFEG